MICGDDGESRHLSTGAPTPISKLTKVSHTVSKLWPTQGLR